MRTSCRCLSRADLLLGSGRQHLVLHGSVPTKDVHPLEQEEVRLDRRRHSEFRLLGEQGLCRSEIGAKQVRVDRNVERLRRRRILLFQEGFEFPDRVGVSPTAAEDLHPLDA